MVYKVFYFIKYSLNKPFKKFIYFKIFLLTINEVKMVIKSKENSIGAWAFLIGVLLAVIIGLFTKLIPIPALTKYSSFIYLILVILGIIVGASINATGRDSQTFLITGTVIVIVSKFGMESAIGSLIGIGIGDFVSSIFGALLVLFIPATIIVAIKTVFGIAKI